jgi:hypothetical protein
MTELVRSLAVTVYCVIGDPLATAVVHETLMLCAPAEDPTAAVTVINPGALKTVTGKAPNTGAND